MGGYAVGIDLGTTNSVVSVYRRGTTETVSVEGRSTMPSVISIDGDKMLVGLQAKRRLEIFPEESVASAKRFMGDRTKFFTIGGKSFTPPDISSFILKKLVDEARKSLGDEVSDAVITVPAYFNEEQKKDTKDAAERAGIKVLRLIAEPTAAAVAYALDREKNQTILVYDLGGGTFDVSILRVTGNEFDVIAVDGDSCLGGDDFDQALVKYLAERIDTDTSRSLLTSDARPQRIALQKLKEEAEKAKIELSEHKECEIIIPDILGRPLEAKITREDFNALIRPMLGRTIEKIRGVLSAAKLTADEIDRVILVGGSTRIPAVQELVSSEIKEPYRSERVDEVVSHGAAVMAASISLPTQDNAPVEILVKDVTAHTLGIDMIESDGHNLYFQPLIKNNSKLPCSGGKLGQTVRPYQKEVIMNVFRGESRIPSENTRLGELRLPISKPSQNAVPIVARFELDLSGIIHFTAVELPFDVNPVGKFFDRFLQKGGSSSDPPRNRAKQLLDEFWQTLPTDGVLTDFKILDELISLEILSPVSVQIKAF